MSYRILFLEDNRNDVKLMQHELNKAGLSHTSMQVTSKQDFLDALQSFMPHAVLADYTIPGFNGMHAYGLFKDLKIQIPFILVTGSLDERLAHEYHSEGIDDYMIKTDYRRLPDLLLKNLKLKEAEIEKQKISAELDRRTKELDLMQQKAEKDRVHQLLSGREYEILCLIASGVPIRSIAERLSLSPATVGTYRARLLDKLELKSNVELTQYALRNKLVK